MYSLTICFGPTGTTWAFMLKDKDQAGAAIEYVSLAIRNGESFSLTDDFGQSGQFKEGVVHSAILEDLDLVEHAHIQRQLANARMQFKAQEQAKTDPVIKQAMNQQRAPILQPMGNGRFGN